MSERRFNRDDFDVEPKRGRSDRHRSRSRSKSRSRRHRRDSRSRSRSRSIDKRHRRRRNSYSRSRSRSRSRGYSSRQDRRRISRRHRDSRSRSKGPSRYRSRSRTPSTRSRHGERHRSRSSDVHDKRDRERELQNIGIPEEQPKKDEKGVKTIKPDYSSDSNSTKFSVENLKLPKENAVGAYYNLDTDEPIDKERIHREMEEKLRLALAKEGKVYPPPKPEATHPVFANDGSFIEIFKKMQEAQQQSGPMTTAQLPIMATGPSAPYVVATAVGKSAPPPPMVGRRRGGKILKTGVVEKQKASQDTNVDPKDFWSLYLAEVNKYKNSACETEGGTRPLVK